MSWNHFLERVSELRLLKPGWSGEACLAPDSDCLDCAVDMAAELPSIVPSITPLRCGGVGLSWFAESGVGVEVAFVPPVKGLGE